jgi:hypothetical protein
MFEQGAAANSGWFSKREPACLSSVRPAVTPVDGRGFPIGLEAFVMSLCLLRPQVLSLAHAQHPSAPRAWREDQRHGANPASPR